MTNIKAPDLAQLTDFVGRLHATMTPPTDLTDLKAIVANLISTSAPYWDDRLKVVQRSYLDALVAELERLAKTPASTFIIKASGTINGERCALYWSEPIPGMGGWTAEQTAACIYTTRAEAEAVLPEANGKMRNRALTLEIKELA